VSAIERNVSSDLKESAKLILPHIPWEGKNTERNQSLAFWDLQTAHTKPLDLFNAGFLTGRGIVASLQI